MGRRQTRWTRRGAMLTHGRHLSRTSRWLHLIDHYASVPAVGLGAVGLLVAGVAVGAVLGFPRGWLTTFEITTSAATLAMVFVIQHTQRREQAATQRKLDELLRALPEADSGLMMIEEASDDDLVTIETDQRQLKNATAPHRAP